MNGVSYFEVEVELEAVWPYNYTGVIIVKIMSLCL